jgi:hypothetical protein
MHRDIAVFKVAMIAATVFRLIIAGIFFMFGFDLQTAWMKFTAFSLAAVWFAHAGYRVTQSFTFLADIRRDTLKDL